MYLYQSEDGTCPVEDFMASIEDSKLRAKVLKDIDLLEKFGNLLKKPHSISLHDLRGSLFELRSKQSTNISRIFYYFRSNSNIILLHAYIKKTKKTPANELTKAYKYKADWEKRNTYAKNL